MRQTYVTIFYVPGLEQDDHGKQQQVASVQLVDGTLRLWSHEHTYNPTAFRSIPLAHMLSYDVKEYR